MSISSLQFHGFSRPFFPKKASFLAIPKKICLPL
jgi:hypothetical protein